VTAGDFVRVMKQLADILRQIAKVAPDPATAKAARQAGTAAWRDVVADSLFGPPGITLDLEAGHIEVSGAEEVDATRSAGTGPDQP